MKHSDCSPLSVPLLPNVVGDIREGCYLLRRAGLLQRSSHLRQYWREKIKIKIKIKHPLCRYVQQKLQHSQATLPFLIT